jgi:hypothetical protein
MKMMGSPVFDPDLRARMDDQDHHTAGRRSNGVAFECGM